MAGHAIRHASPDDAAAMTACVRAAYAPCTGRIRDLPDVSGGIAGDIATHIVLLAERDAKLIGGLVLLPHSDHMILANIAVDPSAQGTGLGRALIERAVAETLKRGLAEIRLKTHSAMVENQRLYERLGWSVTGRTGNTVAMSRWLTAPPR